MTLFGNLFAHEKKAAAPIGALSTAPAQDTSGALSAPMALPQAPPISSGDMVGNIASGFTVPAADQPSFRAPELPKAPPPKAPSLFDKDHRQETFLALASGLLSGQNFGEGMGNAARLLLQEKQGLRREGQPTFGGPDDAFEVYTDPKTGEHTFKPIQAVADYQTAKAARAAALKDKGPSAKDGLDAIGRLASVVSKYDPKDQPQAWAEGRAHLASMGFDGIPEAYHPQYTAFGGAVPTMIRAETSQAAQADTASHRKVQEAQGAERIAQGGARIGLQAQSVAQGGARLGLAQDANRRANAKASGSTVLGGFEYRRDPQTGQIMKRKVQ